MRKLLFLLPMAIVGAAYGAMTKCVYLNPAMNCTAGRALSTYNNKANWDATCSDSTGATKITGAWRCGGRNIYGRQGNRSYTLGTSSENNTACWCKMLTPAVSMWVFHSDVGDYGQGGQGVCYTTCGRLCLEALQTSGATTFKTAMFSSLGE